MKIVCVEYGEAGHAVGSKGSELWSEIGGHSSDKPSIGIIASRPLLQLLAARQAPGTLARWMPYSYHLQA